MPYDLFISYAHHDNERGEVRTLRDALIAGVSPILRRNLNVFFDEDEIPTMEDWENRIGQGLRESRLFLAVISPRYLASSFCRHEWDEYVRYEAMRQCLGDGIAPVYFRELSDRDRSSERVGEMRKRQWCDLVSGRSDVAARLQELQVQIVEHLGRADRALHSRTNLYRHNPQFAGRVRELTRLREALDQQGSVGVVGTFDRAATALHGLGGMGKTELAVAYAHAFGWDYPGGRWLVHCEGASDFDWLLRQLAAPTALDITFSEDERRDSRRAGDRIIAELRRRGRSLLVLDNITDPRLLGPDVLMRLPPRDQLHMIATTRLGPALIGGSPHDHTFVAVDELPDEDAFALIRAHQPQSRFDRAEDAAAVRDLVRLLGGYTLAVETAAIYLGRHTASAAIASYVERLRHDVLETSEEIASDSTVGIRHQERLLGCTLAITLESLTPEESYALVIGALLPPDQVVLPWVQALAARRFADLASGGWSKTTEALRALRLFTPGQEERIVRMHRLVQLLVARRFGTVADLIADLTAHVLERGRHVSYVWEGNQLARWELPPLQRTAAFWLDDKSGSGYELAWRLADPLQTLGWFAEAEFLARKALEFAEAKHGNDSDEVARSANALGAALSELNRYPEAEEQLQRALALDERNHGSDHPDVAVGLANLGALLHRIARLGEAESLLERALNIFGHSPNADRFAVAHAHLNLGNVLEEMHRLNEAERHYRDALSLAEAVVGPGHHRLGVFVNNLASVLKLLNRTDEAKDLLQRALQIAEDAFGRKHPLVATRLNNLAELLREADRFEEAEPIYDQALATTEQLRGPDHPEVARLLNNLGILYHNTGRLAQAEAAYRRAAAIWEASYGPVHWDLAATLGNLAKLLTTLARHDEAFRLFTRAVDIDEQLLGADNPHLAPTLSNFAWLLFAMGRIDEAESVSRRQLSIMVKTCERERREHVYLQTAAFHYLELLKQIGLTESTARSRVDLLLRASGFSVFSTAESR